MTLTMASRRCTIFCVFALLAFSLKVRSEGRCTESDMITLGLKADQVTDDSLRRLGITRYIVKTWVKWKPLFFPDRPPRVLIATIFKDLLGEGIDNFNPNCISCFVKQAECVQNICHISCDDNEYGTECLTCMEQNCHHEFVQCVGKETIRLMDYIDYFTKHWL